MGKKKIYFFNLKMGDGGGLDGFIQVEELGKVLVRSCYKVDI